MYHGRSIIRALEPFSNAQQCADEFEFPVLISIYSKGGKGGRGFPYFLPIQYGGFLRYWSVVDSSAPSSKWAGPPGTLSCICRFTLLSFAPHPGRQVLSPVGTDRGVVHIVLCGVVCVLLVSYRSKGSQPPSVRAGFPSGSFTSTEQTTRNEHGDLRI